MAALERHEFEADPNHVFVVTTAGGARYRLCANRHPHAVCNWAVPESDNVEFCRACRLNETIPNLGDQHRLEAWRRIERAKRRLLYTVLELGLPVETRAERPDGGLSFSFLADEEGHKVFTGHSEGHITLNIAEADDPFREKTRESLGERYRTLLGHFRHEIGHYYWNRLIEKPQGGRLIEPFRKLFGDERVSYADELKRHYDQGPPSGWQGRYVSAYATMHPWEDFAETWAHYLHMVDTLETARSFGLALRPTAPRPSALSSEAVGAPSSAIAPVVTPRLDFDDFEDLIEAWIPLTIALNSLNRSMGLNDLYPFVLSTSAIEKLRFVHDVTEEVAQARRVG